MARVSRIETMTSPTRCWKDRLSPDKLRRAKESDDVRRAEKIPGADNWSNGGWLDIVTAGSGTSLQGGSGWSISGALYVTNLRTRPSLMPVRGPWCGRVCAWVIKYDEKAGEEHCWEKGEEIGPSRLSERLTLPLCWRDCPRLSLWQKLHLHDYRIGKSDNINLYECVDI